MANISQKIYIDVSFFIAFIDRVDMNHARCVAIFEFLAQNHYQVYTSVFTIIQTYNSLAREVGGIIAFEFLQAILESNIQVLHASRSELLTCFRFLKGAQVRQGTLTEIVIATLIQKNDISAILTFDPWPNLMGSKVSSLINP